jgi:hypothetical protein
MPAFAGIRSLLEECVRLPLALACTLLLLACGTGRVLKFPDDKPYANPQGWPLAVASSQQPFLVHYQRREDLAMAQAVVAQLDKAWERQVQVQGWTPPPSDEGLCGPDGRFDVFMWRGINTCQVDIITEGFATAWGGRASYMVIDPWGDYGGELLAATVAHEFNHACHAANDWHELEVAFEMSASYVEQFYGPVEDYSVRDFQAHPDWELLRNDNRDTWYMYGSAIYLHFLRDRYFQGDDSFIPALWMASRNHPDLRENSPHFVDALNLALRPAGATFLDSVAEFARWRAFAGTRNDARHFRSLPTPFAQHALFQKATLPIGQVTLAARTLAVEPKPMVTGSFYVEIVRDQPGQTSFQVALEAPAPGVRWLLQALPGLVAGSDGEVVDLTAGTARVAFTGAGKRTLVLTAMPLAGYDPNQQSGARYGVGLKLTP